MVEISDITPKTKFRVIDLVASLGVDVSAWGEFKGGQSRASTNPKFCYEWTFGGCDDFILVNFWTHQFIEEEGNIVWRKNITDFTQTGNATQRARGKRLESALKRAFEEGIQVRVIICAGERRRDGGKSVVRGRSLDAETWAVTSVDSVTGVFEVSRGAQLVLAASTSISDEIEADTYGFEGQEHVRWFVKHRRREWKFRLKKIASALVAGGGRLRCEVPGCGFDFEEMYGNLGKDFAHVHHKDAVFTYPTEGKSITLEDLAVVCANCHSMIHRGGECRDMKHLIPR